MEIEATKRIVKVFIDGKHRKSFPLYLEDFVGTLDESIILQMDKSVSLKDSDINLIKGEVFSFLLAKFRAGLKTYEKLSFETIKDSEVAGVRIVYPKSGSKRYEMIFDNKIAVRTDEHIYKFAKQLPIAYLNY